MMLGQSRSRTVREGKKGPVVYWMSRDQRADDNWALTYAMDLAKERGEPFSIIFPRAPSFLEAIDLQFRFMDKGLEELRQRFQRLGLDFELLKGDPEKTVSRYIERIGAGTVVVDQDPLKIKQGWRNGVLGLTGCGMIEVDAHNIVPVWSASPKQEYSAATFRPKLRRQLAAHLEDLPPGIGQQSRSADDTGGTHIEPGEAAAWKAMRDFIRLHLPGYAANRNDPNLDGQSGLSPYLHFGMLSAQRLAFEVTLSTAPEQDKAAFLEELTVRRELADNFCFYCRDYDNVRCFPEWARRSLQEHLSDPRQYLYSYEELAEGRTHDPLWNAAQQQMVRTGRMHGYMRMYWAKKILEWSETPGEALAKGVRLNDTYELDGRDPNGYGGLAWSIGGVHDRAWPTRPIFGKVRYMSIGGARSKFDVDEYIARWS